MPDKKYISITVNSARTIIAKLCDETSCKINYHFFTDIETSSANTIVDALNKNA